ncbi:transmembrane protein 79-like [Toxotes jaculatrix]|uniref:transmembrane protein 79-like n=1 Tax=Toxotes jaculatrix TaxID=941984 RepID=UPI001B3AAB7A|nr:transmembrane protein 79-like [Toxotes jaculatrix]XP_040910021.1 transmembrane protein 79-like [Toxotes jaculatrix]XP_040910022.1 transmembrane protein 79-like [Toxotes jaculatrix]XP_040910024.1 transmembrane protein 79-like [Toxotes jaculatrix]XP_040910025.1 transmembrane protein 79-like [Toxotes jaculatrix]
MSGLGGLTSELTEDVTQSPDGPIAEPPIAANKKPQENNSVEETNKITHEEEESLKEEEDQEKEEEEEEKVTSSALLEPSTLPWPGDRDKRPQADIDDGIWSERGVSEPEERDTGISGGSQDLSEKQSQAESDKKIKAKWRESMPEGERWRDDEIKVHRDNEGDSSEADDEHEEDEAEEELDWISEKAALGFTPQVTIVRPSSREHPEESLLFIEKDIEKELQVESDSAVQVYAEWTEQDDKYYLCEHLCNEKVRLALATVAAGLLFPLLVWGGYELLPFDSPLVESAPLRVVYTLRCSFFATIPLLLGLVVHGVARLRYSALTPLYESKVVNREVAVHWHYVNQSLALFLFYFLQLTVMATYISQDLVKLVPLLTIIFVFGRLIYWLCLSLGSSFRALGFGFSFFPILVMLGANLYYVCSSVGQGAVFDVAPPTTAPPPRQRWWG